jgi:hypothetical protein
MARTQDADLERELFTLTLTSEQEDALIQRVSERLQESRGSWTCPERRSTSPRPRRRSTPWSNATSSRTTAQADASSSTAPSFEHGSGRATHEPPPRTCQIDLSTYVETVHKSGRAPR